MFTVFLASLVLVTTVGTPAILSLAGVPIVRLFAPDSKTWKAVLTVIHLTILLAAVIQISFQPRLWGEPVLLWALLPFGVYLWVKCAYLVRSRNVA